MSEKVVIFRKKIGAGAKTNSFLNLAANKQCPKPALGSHGGSDQTGVMSQNRGLILRTVLHGTFDGLVWIRGYHTAYLEE